MSDVNDLKKVLECVVNEGECRFDHHGYCQEHGWMSEEECFVKTARRLLNTILDTNKDFEYSMSMMEKFVKNNQNEVHDQYSKAWYYLRSLLILNNKQLLAWTHNKPDQEGAYWYSHNPKSGRAVIVNVYENHHNIYVIHGEEGDTIISETPESDMWYGPLYMPPANEENEDV